MLHKNCHTKSACSSHENFFVSNGKTCSSSLDICWVRQVCMAPVQDASSLRRLSSFCMSNCKRENNWLKRSLSPLCSKE
uniref:Uncharacterized protein n=1 Tax=Arundo donax TaxID=35708 RepID=A0A0A9D1A8_ARUDO